MGDDELLTVLETAELVGVSKQYIYAEIGKKDHGRLAGYVVMKDNRKFIKKSAIYEVFHKEQPESNVVGQSSKQDNREDTEFSGATGLVDLLENQLRQKDRQIDALNARLQEALHINVMQQQRLLELTTAGTQATAQPKKGFWTRLKDLFRG